MSTDCLVTIDWFVFCGSVQSDLFHFKVKSLRNLKNTKSVFVLKNDKKRFTNEESEICKKLNVIPIIIDDLLINSIKKYTTSTYFCILQSNLSFGNLNILNGIFEKNKVPFQPKYYTESGDKYKSTNLAKKHNMQNYEYKEEFEIECNSGINPHFIVTQIFLKMCKRYSLKSDDNFMRLYFLFLLQYHSLENWYIVSHNLFYLYKETDLPLNNKNFCFILNLLKIEKEKIEIDHIEYTPKVLTRYYKNKNNGFNPSVIRYNDQIYCMLRFETEVGKKHQRWGKSKMRYNIVKLSLKDNKLQKKYSNYCNLKTSFTFNNDNYHEVNRDKTSTNKVGFEDGKFIDGTQHLYKDDECVMAYFTLLRNYDVRYKFNKEKKEYVCVYHDIDTKVALCRVNLTKKNINFLNYFDLQSQNQIDKNWASFTNKNLKYIIHTWSPLTYTSAKKWDDLNFVGDLPNYEMNRDDYLSISCAPIEMSENEYVAILHKKDHWYSYRFYLAKFRVENGKLLKSKMYQLNVPARFHFFTSIFKISAKQVLICGGRHDCHSIYFHHKLLD